jgi:hypothetical protein
MAIDQLTSRVSPNAYTIMNLKVVPHTFLLYQGGLRGSDKYGYPCRTSDNNICGVKKNDFKEDSTFNAASETTGITDKYDKLVLRRPLQPFPTHLTSYLPIPALSTHFGPLIQSARTIFPMCIHSKTEALDKWITKDALKSAKIPKPEILF